MRLETLSVTEHMRSYRLSPVLMQLSTHQKMDIILLAVLEVMILAG